MKVTIYRNYRFIDKDPIIDAMRTVVKSQEKLSNTVAHQITGIATGTFDGWFDGKTRKPQNASSTQAMAGLGYVRRDTLDDNGNVTVSYVRARSQDHNKEIEKQTAWFLKHHEPKKKRTRKKKPNGTR